MTQPTKQSTLPTDDFDFSIAEGTNQDYVDVYPRIQWQHGSRQLSKLGDVVAHTGGLFLPTDQFPNFTADGWKEDSFITAQNDEIKGWSTTKGSLAVLRVKSWWPEGEGSKTHFLVCIPGVNGLFSLQVGGISKGQPMQSAFTAHRNQIVAMVNRVKPAGANNFEPFALWFVVEPGSHESQTSKKDSSKGSEVTKPRLFTPETVDIEYARTLWVGADNYKQFCQLYKDSELWQTQFPKSVDHTPEDLSYTGSDPENGITPQQSEFLGGMIEAKSLGLDEIKEMTLTVSNGATNNLRQLTREEAGVLIDTMKAY